MDQRDSGSAKSYYVRTLGCQMNVHDSERMGGLLEEAGYEAAVSAAQADLVVINTCAVRENADNKLYGNLGQLAERKRKHPQMQIAVAGCLAQKDRHQILERAPWVDVVVGTHNIDALPILLKRSLIDGESQIEIAEQLQAFPSDMPVRRQSAHSAWVSISVGCNNTCTFCIVPALRGRERDRRPGDILAEVEALAIDGVREVTLLGQNVNAYGVEFGDRNAFAELLRTVGAVPGIRRVRFTSPHPRDFTNGVIAAMADTPSVMPHLHMPLQSGSDTVLQRMRRSYRSTRYLAILAEVRSAMPQAAITTDLIVGFPGETDAEFAETIEVVKTARFASAYTFQYSARPGTPAATYPDQVPREVISERYQRLSAVIEAGAWQLNRELIGTTPELMVVSAVGRKDVQTERMTGRAPDNRLVHFARPESVDLSPGDLVAATITDAAPHHLLADSEVVVVDRAPIVGSSCGATAGAKDTPSTVSLGAVSLGMPVLGRPAVR